MTLKHKMKMTTNGKNRTKVALKKLTEKGPVLVLEIEIEISKR
jgi:hypothetical protein